VHCVDTDGLLLRLDLARFNLLEHVVGLGRPDKGWRLTIMFFDISEDAFLESWRAAQPAPEYCASAYRPLALLFARWSELWGYDAHQPCPSIL